jgi:HSP20 family molecular chaperone IbpA
MKNILHSKISLFLIALFTGIVCHYSISTDLMAADKKITTASEFNETYKSDVSISQREDDNFKYVDIIPQGAMKNAMKVNVVDGMVNIQSEVKKEKSVENKDSSEYSSYQSSFNQSFSVPEGVNDKKAEVINQKDKVIVKFPKYKFTM